VDGSRVEMESDIDDAAAGMLSSLATNGNRIAYREFEIVAKYYSKKSSKNIEAARENVKRIMIENSMEPKPSGLLRSTRWYRRIKT
jgi:ribosomal protein L16/L10AE